MPSIIKSIFVYFSTRLKNIRQAFAPTKFVLLVDLGIITVPEDYVHETALASFRGRNTEKLKHFDDRITDTNFRSPSYVLRPGDRLWVRAYKQLGPDTTSLRERMSFLDGEGAVYTGAQGACLVFEQKRDKLPKGYWYSSLDKKNHLWLEDGYVLVPELSTGGEDFCFFVGYFNLPCLQYMAFLSFSKVLSRKPSHRGRLLGT